MLVPKKQNTHNNPLQLYHVEAVVFQGLQTCTCKASQAFKAFKASLGTS